MALPNGNPRASSAFDHATDVGTILVADITLTNQRSRLVVFLSAADHCITASAHRSAVAKERLRECISLANEWKRPIKEAKK